MDKKALSERDICTKYITPAIAKGGWDVQAQVRENVHLTKGRVIVRGRLVSRGTAKFADYVLYAQPNANIPLAIVEAKDNNHGVGESVQRRHVPRPGAGDPRGEPDADSSEVSHPKATETGQCTLRVSGASNRLI